MKQITDQSVLFIYCFISILLTSVDTAFLAAFLISVIYIAINYCCHWKLLHIFSIIAYTAAAFFFPALLHFFPIILYNLLINHIHAGIPIPAILGFFYFLPEDVPLFFHLLCGCLIALVLEHHTVTYNLLDDEYRKTRDDSTELNLLLKEKNQTILKKQDDEIYTATLKERNRIAREIHDNVGHMLSRSILMTGAMKMVNKNDALSEPLLQLETTLNAAMTSVRESVHDLHDDSVNLKDVFINLTSSFTFCPIELQYDMGHDIPKEIKYSFITITKEGLHNIARHSNATSGRILVREHPGLYQLVIEDNGSLLNKADSSGLGLTNMQERISALNGNIQFRNDKGFCIFITVPKKEINQ